MKKQFENSFWLRFRHCDIKTEVKRKIVVNMHHSLIMQFIKGEMETFLTSAETERKQTERQHFNEVALYLV